jgi:hypothetical protein
MHPMVLLGDEDRILFWAHPIVLLGDEAQMEAHFGRFGDSANREAR